MKKLFVFRPGRNNVFVVYAMFLREKDTLKDGRAGGIMLDCYSYIYAWHHAYIYIYGFFVWNCLKKITCFYLVCVCVFFFIFICFVYRIGSAGTQQQCVMWKYWLCCVIFLFYFFVSGLVHNEWRVDMHYYRIHLKNCWNFLPPLQGRLYCSLFLAHLMRREMSGYHPHHRRPSAPA